MPGISLFRVNVGFLRAVGRRPLAAAATMAMGWLIAVVAGACGPDEPSIQAEPTDVPPRPAPPPAEYLKEKPPVDPCDELTESLRRDFPELYHRAKSPRFAVIANVFSGDVADAGAVAAERRADDQSALGRRPVWDSQEGVLLFWESPSVDQALPVDRSSVENHFIHFLLSLAPDVQVVDPGVVREQLLKKVGDKPASVGQDLCEICILLDVRVAREGPVSGQRTMATTARAIRLSDGAVLAVSTPKRRDAFGERDVDSRLRRMCYCGGAFLMDELSRRWRSTPP